MKAARKLQRFPQPQSLIGYVRQFLTPTVWKQARHVVPWRRCAPRWDLQPLILIMLAMTWATGDSQAEKFAKARGFYVACHATRKRPGTTLIGFQKALRRLPMRQLRALAAGVRQEISARRGAARRAATRRWLRADGLRRRADRVPPHPGVGTGTKTGR